MRFIAATSRHLEELMYALEKTQGNYAAAARQLGVSPRMMYYRARGVGIDRSPSAT